jgi:uncharacterized protein (TIGR04255 family)
MPQFQYELFYKLANIDLTPTSYVRPPIIEAVIGIDFVDQTSKDMLSSAKDKLLANYSDSREFEDVQISFDLNTKATQSEVSKKTATTVYRLSSSDLTQQLFLRPLSFTLSQLAPYPGWDEFFNRFQRDWKVWKRAVGFRQIKRIGVRYINRIDIPVPSDRPDKIVEESNFLNVYPMAPKEISPFSAYAIQMTSQLNSVGCQLALQSAVVPSPVLDHISVVVDQDIARIVDIPQKDEALFSLLEDIRVAKNSVFEACISDKSRELFN